MFSYAGLVVAVLLAVLSASFAQSYPKVSLEVYYEALCPGCQQFVTGPLTNTLALPDIVEILNLKMVPYGNTKKNSDGTFTCQHGVDECTSDAYELCTLYHLSGNMSSIATGDTSLKAFPFIQCMEINDGNPAAAESCFNKNMASSGLSWRTVSKCYETEFTEVQSAGASATPTHDYVPWVLVDGAVVQNTNALLATICKAYTGPSPASCKRFFKIDEALPCKNTN